jgi:hypothetical protein
MVLRVFPRRTNATPTDDNVRIGEPGLLDGEYDLAHVSVTFSWDRREGDRLAAAWGFRCRDVQVGGPAHGDPGGEFMPGMYLGEGHTITSRGCPGSCWFCDVPKREGPLRELPIRDGWKLHDSNLLACSRQHVEAVFDMLERQPKRAEFLGGLEAARLEPWHVRRLGKLDPRSVFMAYDTPDDLEPLRVAGRRLITAGVRGRYCYVLVGYKWDTFDDAERRLREAGDAGFLPRAMLFRDRTGRRDPVWRTFARKWHRPAIVRAMLRPLALPYSVPTGTIERVGGDDA